MKKFLLVWCSSLWLLTNAVAGPTAIPAPTLTISLPVNGAVYQQDAEGKANIQVSGAFNSTVFATTTSNFEIKAQLTKLNLTTGNPTGEADITFPLSQWEFDSGKTPYFGGSAMVAKGWYRLRVEATRTYNGRNFLYVSTNNYKVGVGEVFVIAGQSNAQGACKVSDQHSAAGTVAMDAVRVSANVLEITEQVDPNARDRQYPGSYRRLDNLRSTQTSTVIGPLGQCLWYWGSAGAKLAQDLQVPVMFFNTAYYGTTITNWVTSTNAENRTSTGTNPNAGIIEGRYAPGSPFYFFANALQLYADT